MSTLYVKESDLQIDNYKTADKFQIGICTKWNRSIIGAPQGHPKLSKYTWI